MHVDVAPLFFELAVGQVGHVSVTVTNTTHVIDRYQLHVFGLDPAWVTFTPDDLSLFPDETGQVDLAIELPESFPAGRRELSVHVQSDNTRSEFALAPISLGVTSRPRVGLRVEPSIVTGGRTATFDLVVLNEGNATIEAPVGASDPEDLAEFDFEPRAVTLVPGRREVVHATVSGPRPWFGQMKPRVITFHVLTPAPVTATATFLQRPRIGRWVISLLGLMTAAAVFAAVLSQTFDKIVSQSKLDTGVIDQALGSDRVSIDVPTSPAGITGLVVIATTGAGVGGVTAQLFSADNANVPLASAATTTDGSYAFGNLNGRPFRLRFTGAGFAPVWYPAAATFGDGQDVTPVEGAPPTQLERVLLAGRPGGVKGTVIAADPKGAVATLVVPGVIDSEVKAQVQTTDVSADGAFEFENVPAPARYQLVVRRQGATTESRDVFVPAAQIVDGIEVFLRSGDGVIEGRVESGGVRLGGVSVGASDGNATTSTVSLTTADKLGEFSIRGLATPGRYTITATLDGFQRESRTVSLAAGQALPGIVINLTRARGSISGTVRDPTGQPLGGVTVTVQGGEVSLTTTTVSQGEVGTFLLQNIAAPGNYTVTFSRPGSATQSRLVVLDPLGGRLDLTGVDADLAAANSVVKGTVVSNDGTALPLAELTLTDGRTTRTVRSASVPAGAFEFADLPPGAYTLTATRKGSSPAVILVSTLPGEVKDLGTQLRLGTRASFTGVVNRQASTGALTPAAGINVRLFLAAKYPTESLLSTTTDASGRYSFRDLDAPEDFIIAVFDSASASDALGIQLIASVPGTPVDVPPFNLTPTP